MPPGAWDSAVTGETATGPARPGLIAASLVAGWDESYRWAAAHRGQRPAASIGYSPLRMTSMSLSIRATASDAEMEPFRIALSCW